MFHWGFPPIIGGAETHLTILCPELVRQGHPVSLLTGAVEGIRSDYLYQEVVRIKRTPLMDLNWLCKRGMEGLEREVLEAFSAFLKETEPDIIHVHNMHYFSEIHAHAIAKLARERKAPLVLTAHNIWDDGVFLRLVLEIDWDEIIAVSDFIRRELVGVGVRGQKVTAIHHGIDHQRFFKPQEQAKSLEKYPVLRGRRAIFHPARIGLAKGCDISVKALRIIKESFPQVLLVLAGTKNVIDWNQSQQKDIAYLLHLINKLGLDDNVFISLFSLEDMVALYQAVEFSVYPSSHAEPFGLTMLESLAAGKPMIVTECGGMPEIIKDGQNGFVIKPRDYQALAERCIRLLSDEELRIRLGEQGRRFIEEKHTAKIMTDNVLKVYKRALSS